MTHNIIRMISFLVLDSFRDFSEESNLSFFNCFCNSMSENEEKTKRVYENPPEYFQYEKSYTMGPGIDFPLVMNYTDTDTINGQRYFYFLNGHNDVVFFADENFTEDQIESYEYDPFGNLEMFGNVNSLIFNSLDYDKDSGLYQIPSGTFYNSKLGLVIKNMVYSKEAVPIGKEFAIYPSVINNIIVSLLPSDEEPPDEEDGRKLIPPLKIAYCGDGYKDPGEECDDGNTNNKDCCDTNCMNTKYCKPIKPNPSKMPDCDYWIYIFISGHIYRICIPPS